MVTFLVRRLAHALLVLLVVCSVTFGIVHAAPGGPSLLADPKLSAVEREGDRPSPGGGPAAHGAVRAVDGTPGAG